MKKSVGLMLEGKRGEIFRRHYGGHIYYPIGVEWSTRGGLFHGVRVLAETTAAGSFVSRSMCLVCCPLVYSQRQKGNLVACRRRVGAITFLTPPTLQTLSHRSRVACPHHATFCATHILSSFFFFFFFFFISLHRLTSSNRTLVEKK